MIHPWVCVSKCLTLYIYSLDCTLQQARGTRITPDGPKKASSATSTVSSDSVFNSL